MFAFHKKNFEHPCFVFFPKRYRFKHGVSDCVDPSAGLTLST